MAESFQERTEAPTPRKLEEARNKGQVPRSIELTTAASLLASGVLMAVTGPHLASGLADILGNGAAGMVAAPTTVEGAAEWLRETVLRGFAATAPLLGGLALASGLIAAIQARGVFTLEPLRPDLSRLAPHKNAARIWGTRAIAELAKSILKLLVIGIAMYVSLRSAWPELMVLGQKDAFTAARLIGRFATRLLLTAGGAYIVIAGADYAYQLWMHDRKLRMTKEEVKRELKETDGDPIIKSRLRSLGRDMVRRKMFRDVPAADVVVTNPTHIAVALKYDPLVSPAPIVLAMGQRKIAERIRQIALDAGVPIVENRPLARALLAAGRIGLPIPVELYVAVAEVLAFVFRRRSAGRAWKGSAVL